MYGRDEILLPATLGESEALVYGWSGGAYRSPFTVHRSPLTVHGAAFGVRCSVGWERVSWCQTQAEILSDAFGAMFLHPTWQNAAFKVEYASCLFPELPDPNAKRQTANGKR
jgi:hypothetical protein